MNLDGADRILRAVGSDCYPIGIDRSALRRGLLLCAEWYREALHYSTDKAEKEQLVRLGQISKTTKKLKLLLQEEDRQTLYGWDSVVQRQSSRGDTVMQTLDRLIIEVEGNLKKRTEDTAHAAYVRSFQKRSAFEWLVGYWLPMVYMQLQFSDPGSKEAYLAPGSPFIRFAVAALNELQVRKGDQLYSHSSVVKAAAMPFSPRVRRKDATAEDHYQWWRTQLMRKTLMPDLFSKDDGMMIVERASEVEKLQNEQDR